MSKALGFFFAVGLLTIGLMAIVSSQKEQKQMLYEEAKAKLVESDNAEQDRKIKNRDKEKAWKFVVNRDENVMEKNYKTSQNGTPIFLEHPVMGYPEVDYSNSVYDPSGKVDYSEYIAESFKKDKEQARRECLTFVRGGETVNKYGETKYLEGSAENLIYIHPQILNTFPEICLEAIRTGYDDAIKYVPKEVRMKYTEISVESMKRDADNIKHIPQEILYRNKYLCVMAVNKNYLNFIYVPFADVDQNGVSLFRKSVFEEVYAK